MESSCNKSVVVLLVGYFLLSDFLCIISTMPAPAPPMAATHNKMGYSIEAIDPYTGIFLQRMRGARKPVAELGSGFGIVTEHLLAAGATVIANDLSADNLREVEQRVPVEQRSRLTLVPGDATQMTFPDNGLSGIMAGRWVHFLTTPEAYRDFLGKAWTWLEPGGALCITVHTMKAWCPPEVNQEYERKRDSGVEWPGWVNRTMLYEGLTGRVPDLVYAFQPQELKALVEAAGFVVDDIGLYGLALPNHPSTEDNDLAEGNTLGLVAIKPIANAIT
ncbi:uncharacterized protein LOC129586054 [Paramacrobiotus metropolitanus]|uniref:uncharacterized protein LOC129586054 n=1 Tax=Paramacrobiotus metropolitanus TaxID=2943436 RepID=UPI00244658B8|nr:uncharacterized protein LOC129586054 [Paramacrobiotus metropolitanus]